MKKGKHMFRGLSAALAVLMLICMSLTTLTLGNTTWINSNLNIQDTKTIGGSDEFAVYWANDYGYDSTALIEVYYDAADANVEIAQEGMTLLKNDNAALPLADGTRFTIFGNAAVNSNIYRNSCPDYIPYVDFVSAMQTQFGADNVNTVLCNEVYPELGSTGTNSVAEAESPLLLPTRAPGRATITTRPWWSSPATEARATMCTSTPAMTPIPMDRPGGCWTCPPMRRL